MFPILAISQKIQSPVWSQSHIYFETAKISKFNTSTKKFGVETYKTASIFIENANLSTPTLTVDIPDIFFMKEGNINSIKYEQADDGSENITYDLIKEKKYIGVTLYFGQLDQKPNRIFIYFSDNYLSKTLKGEAYNLLEVK